MADTDSAPEDLGAPQSFLVLADGTPVYDRAGDRAGTVEHVLSDDQDEIFHGLVIKTRDGHRYAPADQVDGIFAHGVIVAVPADQLTEPREDAAGGDDSLADGLRRAWNWLVQPK
ncbi:PRC-barrel domain-containing protein [Pseudosporangium ferrugineum]|uniref:PRC-barrel domain protein n=1 Tax=Pseudosporangium ferrugineum TaxID=439699 RepID=A0A2T0RIN1_9ACTN|nr:PRC-barrel domain-containing protein [Pseudosporangium ferrugineum]PRY21043.1 PRC-barrel domain protein [Pseudosporangium ferrugineum]